MPRNMSARRRWYFGGRSVGSDAFQSVWTNSALPGPGLLARFLRGRVAAPLGASPGAREARLVARGRVRVERVRRRRLVDRARRHREVRASAGDVAFARQREELLHLGSKGAALRLVAETARLVLTDALAGGDGVGHGVRAGGKRSAA